MIETGPPGLQDEPPPMPAVVVSPSPSASRQRFISMVMLGAEVAWLLIQTVFMILDAVYHAIKPNDGKDLSGKLVLITGAGHGLGKETALQFARQGCRVACVDVNKVGNDETVREIIMEAEKAGVVANGKPLAKAYVCNVADRKKIQDLAVQVTKDMGEVDILVNNAGILTEHSFRDATPEEIDLTINVNLTSHFWTIQSFLPGMLKRNSGHIVAIASVGSFIGVANFSTYCATKYAVDGLMSSLHEEFRNKQKDIKLTTVHPYFINTRPDLIKGWHHRLPLITPDRVAAAVVRGVRRESISVTIPKFLFYLIAISRFFPQNVIDIWRDVFYTHITPPNKIAPAAPAQANGTASSNGIAQGTSSVANGAANGAANGTANGAANGVATEVKKDL